ncbi:ATP-dependent DNA helicase DDX11 (DEAD/H-box protein 11) [Durusdinium trenchii]|uniref:ATP-dependent DNA helicase DDX11 (DEAD/H-box protein 11) n=1 Tax=Durusdinium trenchii TaxID=1381693 RepID=A0ABP0JC39_9DINO
MAGAGTGAAGAGARWAWPFAFEPYGIQRELMGAVWQVLDGGEVGILESPTGTGKSLSLICSALHWLKSTRGRLVRGRAERKEEEEEERRRSGEAATAAEGAAQPEWISAFKAKKRREERSLAERKYQERRERVERDRKLVVVQEQGDGAKRRPAKRRRRVVLDSDEEFAPDSADEDEDDWRKRAYASDQEEDEASLDGSDVEDPEDNGIRKIFFCSRTHSQLSQFMNEVKRTPFGREVACVALGSRVQLCSNPLVAKLGTATKINDKCLELADAARGRKSSSKSGGADGGVGNKWGRPSRNQERLPRQSACPYFDRSSALRMRDHILFEATDIEAVAEMATKARTCGYYSARASVGDAELVALPYSMLLHEKTRKSLGISLKGNVVIFDEAHNVMEAINDVHSVTIELGDLQRGHQELLEYQKRYRTRLRARNKLGITNLTLLVRKLCEFLAAKPTAGKVPETTEVLTSGALAIRADADHINLFETLQYLEDSQLSKKLRGFAEKYIYAKTPTLELNSKKRVSAAQPEASRRRASAIQQVQRFLEAMTNTNKDGQVLVVRDGAASRMKFLMLNPGTYFRQIVDEAHSVILAGGTMKPTKDVETQLFGHLAEGDIRLFSCGHVIPRHQMACICVSKGPTGKTLQLNVGNRAKPAVMDEIGLSLVNIAGMVPNGMVVFLPSYAYLEQLIARWRATGLLQRLEARKKVFRDAKESNKAEAMLQRFDKAAQASRPGAILFSVVGGRLSEGINFKDHLARCVVMVGLPYPNPHDPEMKAKMAYLDKTKSTARSQQRALSSKEFYENQCMKAVNQCIGRAIRHQHDFAAVVLLDGRYAMPHVASKLPEWIAGSHQEFLQAPDIFGKVVKGLAQFFARNQPP